MLNKLKEIWRNLNSEYPCDFLDECRRIPFSIIDVADIDRKEATPVLCPSCKKLFESHPPEVGADIPNMFSIYFDRLTGAILVQHSCGREYVLSGDGSLLQIYMDKPMVAQAPSANGPWTMVYSKDPPHSK
ncbi:MAG: hypothetical protein HXS54_05860 [Theionarchaea archaeon]|nr:hypothetical protein [Theionarchaea archaeon]DBA34893.1 TPA_asm: hypothetical protein vir521_00099 [Caudoviricetes sp. vir521]